MKRKQYPTLISLFPGKAALPAAVNKARFKIQPVFLKRHFMMHLGSFNAAVGQPVTFGLLTEAFTTHYHNRAWGVN